MRTISIAASLTILITTLLAPEADARRKRKVTADQKIGHYVYVINTVASSVFRSRADYGRWVNFKKGPTCTEKRISGVRSPGYTPNLPRDLMKTVKARPKLKKLDKKAKQMAIALDALYKLQREAATYYRRRGYKKDNCAKARALHKKLVNAWAAYADADYFIRGFVTKRNDARAAKELKTIKRKYGKRMRYWHKRGIVDGKAALQVIKAQMRAGEKRDLTKMRAAHDKYAPTVAKITALATKNRAVADTFGYLRFQRKAAAYLKAVNELVSRLESGKPLSKYQQKQLDKGATYIKGTMPVVFNKYNAMITESNRIRFPRKVK